MSRKRGKKPKVAVEAIPDDILAEGSGSVRSATAAQADAIATVEDVVTTADIATTDDVVTADDVVATAVEPASGSGEPSPKPRPVRAAEETLQEDIAAPLAPELDPIAIASTHGLDLSGAGNGDDDDDDVRSGYAAGRSADHDGGDGYAARSGSRDGDDDRVGYAAYGASDDHDGTGDGDGYRRGDAYGGGASNGDGDGNGYGNGDGHGSGDDSDGDGEGDGDGDDDAAIVFPTSAASMDAVQLKHLVEALIFASDRPLTVQRLRQLTRVGEVRRLEQALTELAEDYRERGLVLQQVSGGYQFRTRTQFSPWVQQLIAGRPVRLSRAQLETLAIIAYRQPITRPEIDDIRGVDSSATLKLLIDRMLIRVLGKREEVGRPILYGTTKEFLDFFSLGDLRELPTLREYSELTAESRKVMSDRLGIEPDGVDAAGLGTHGSGATRPHWPHGSSNGEPHSPSNGEPHGPSNGEPHGPSNGSSNGSSNGLSNGISNGTHDAAHETLHDGADDSPAFDHESSELEPGLSDIDASSNEVEAASAELEAASAELEAASAELEAVSGEIDAVSAELEAASGEIDAVSAELEAASGDIDARSAQVEAASGDIYAGAADIEVASGELEVTTGELEPASNDLEAVADVEPGVADIDAGLDSDAAAPTHRREPDAE